MKIDTKDFRCAYCGERAEQVTGKEIYPHRPEFYWKKFWRCVPCQAYVGCHGRNPRLGFQGNEPLGRLANAELRAAKGQAHTVFDGLWKNGPMSRGEAYMWLARQLDIPKEQCHIGYFDVATCRRVVEICTAACLVKSK